MIFISDTMIESMDIFTMTLQSAPNHIAFVDLRTQEHLTIGPVLPRPCLTWASCYWFRRAELGTHGPSD